MPLRQDKRNTSVEIRKHSPLWRCSSASSRAATIQATYGQPFQYRNYRDGGERERIALKDDPDRPPKHRE
jgi:hypothetical protein